VTGQERIDHLRRRVLEDPASIAFAQLAEEYRRCGDCQAAVDTCRSGLVTHPHYLSARVTLGRALVALDRLDEAHRELEYALAGEPDSVGALRGMGELHLRRGNRDDAHQCFTRALALAPYDAELERAVSQLTELPLTADVADVADVNDARGSGDVDAAKRWGPASGMTDEERVAPLVRTATTIAALEEWLSAIYVARTNRSA
jgi:tetratricopeptide (TPR) repeat protein